MGTMGCAASARQTGRRLAGAVGEEAGGILGEAQHPAPGWRWAEERNPCATTTGTRITGTDAANGGLAASKKKKETSYRRRPVSIHQDKKEVVMPRCPSLVQSSIEDREAIVST